VNLVY